MRNPLLFEASGELPIQVRRVDVPGGPNAPMPGPFPSDSPPFLFALGPASSPTTLLVRLEPKAGRFGLSGSAGAAVGARSAEPAGAAEVKREKTALRSLAGLVGAVGATTATAAGDRVRGRFAAVAAAAADGDSAPLRACGEVPGFPGTALDGVVSLLSPSRAAAGLRGELRLSRSASGTCAVGGGTWSVSSGSFRLAAPVSLVSGEAFLVAEDGCRADLTLRRGGEGRSSSESSFASPSGAALPGSWRFCGVGDKGTSDCDCASARREEDADRVRLAGEAEVGVAKERFDGFWAAPLAGVGDIALFLLRREAVRRV